MKKHGEMSLSGVGYPTPSNQCWPQPVPYIFENFQMQMLHQPDKVTILYSNPDHEFRHVRLNQPHPSKGPTTHCTDAAAGYNLSLLIRWFRLLLRQILQQVLATLQLNPA